MTRLMTEDRESVGIPIPTGQPAVRDCDPQIVMLILGDGLNEIARQPIRGAAAIAVSEQPVSVITDQAILRTEPDKTLGVLQGYVHRALGQTVRRGQMLEYRRRSGRLVYLPCLPQRGQQSEKDTQLQRNSEQFYS